MGIQQMIGDIFISQGNWSVFTRRRIILSAAEVLQKTVLLLIRRTLGDDPQYSFFTCNA
jgi:hypothetical protein